MRVGKKSIFINESEAIFYSWGFKENTEALGFDDIRILVKNEGIEFDFIAGLIRQLEYDFADLVEPEIEMRWGDCTTVVQHEKYLQSVINEIRLLQADIKKKQPFVRKISVDQIF